MRLPSRLRVLGRAARQGGEIYSGNGCAASAWPTNDGLTMTYVAGRIADFEAVRRDPTAHLDRHSPQGRQPGRSGARGCTQVGPRRGTSDLPNSLVELGDQDGRLLPGTRASSWIRSPVSALAMRLRDDRVAIQAIVSGSGAPVTQQGALARYEKQRNRETSPTSRLTLGLARLRGVNEIEERLFAAIGADERRSVQLLRRAHRVLFPCGRSSARST